jgi:endoglucanase
MHQYFDGNSSGTSPACVNENIGVQRIQNATSWLKSTGHKGFLGEFGASKDSTCLMALKNTLEYIEKNADVWEGWTYWAASKWFGDYMFNIYPPDPIQSPQMKIIKLYLPQLNPNK